MIFVIVIIVFLITALLYAIMGSKAALGVNAVDYTTDRGKVFMAVMLFVGFAASFLVFRHR